MLWRRQWGFTGSVEHQRWDALEETMEFHMKSGGGIEGVRKTSKYIDGS